LSLAGGALTRRNNVPANAAAKSAASWLVAKKNDWGAKELSGMANRDSELIGPMSLQPVEHRSTQAVQSPAVKPARTTRATAPKKRTVAQVAAQAAKASISRRNSLRKQRELQKS
jgi:hypothetical protein